MFKRVLSVLLATSLVVTQVPMDVLAETRSSASTDINDYLQESRLPGDVNGDGKVDLKDILALKQCIKDGTGSGNLNADANEDGTVDANDLELVKGYVAEDKKNELSKKLVTVEFYDGNSLIDSFQAVKGKALGNVPATNKSSKAGHIFEGWYTTPEGNERFYASEPVTGNLKVYAKYSEMEGVGSDLTITSFAQMDMGTDASFQVVGSGNINDITLAVKDGSDPVELDITGSDASYTVTAKDGFKEGASYELTLPEGLNFVGTEGKTLPDTVRTASFTIKKEAVDNLKLSDDIHYVQNDNPSALKEGDHVALTEAKDGDLICFYKTTNPKDRDYKTSAYMDDPETWFKVGSVGDGTVTLAKLEDTDSEKMYEVPDNFPVKGTLPTGDSGTLTLAVDDDGYELDTEFYKQMVEEGVNADLTYANQKIGVGDFISIYASTDNIDDENDIYFGKITAYDSSTGVLTYTKSSAGEIEASMDLYVQPVLEGDDLLSEEAKEQIEEAVLAQVEESGFAEEAGFMLAELATRTDGFRNMDGVDVLFSDENGNPLSDEEIELLNLGKSFELKDGVELKVEIVTSGDQLHYKDKGSVQLGIGIDAQFEVEVEDGGKVVIDLSATFVQELAIGVTANGELVKKKILFIPIPIGVKIGSSVDLLSYTGVRVDVHAYTVAEEDKPIWDQLQEVAKNPEKLADVLPANDKFAKVKEGLETVGDVFDKIDEVKGKIEQARDNAEKAKEYTEDLAMLWEMVDEMKVSGLPGEKKWEEMGKTLGKTNISKDLMDMLDLSTETELDADRYADSLEDLLTKYSEMLEKETDWVKLVQEEMCQTEVNINGLVIYAKADFVVRADMNIAMGANIQYQVGKRYTFWVKVGLFKPEAGSATMDLVDEEFAFQFYVMGKLGIKMGVEATAGFAIGAADVARVGIHLELGPYVKLYGFFIYEYERSRAANTSAWVSNERMAGALYLDFGLYLIVGVDAAALDDLFEVSYDFVDTEFPLLEAGEKKYPYAFQYEPQEDELVLVQDEDVNSKNGITMTLPEEYRAVKYCNLETGKLSSTVYNWNNYNVTLSNPNFHMDGNGVISVDVPDNTRYMECDLTLTYKYGKLAFSQYDMQVTIPLVWTNLSTDEIKQYYTASVRVGNDTDGYETVWSKRVRKNQEFKLPTKDEVKKLIGYDEAKYSSFTCFDGAGQTTSLIENKTYDCAVDYKPYSITVNGIQNADGTTGEQTFTTHYGDAFDFSALEKTGTNITNDVPEQAKFTKFVNVTTSAIVSVGTDKGGQQITEVIDLTQPVTGKVAQAIADGSVTATANYVDDSVLVTYQFTGINAPKHEERIRKGTVSDYDFSTIVAEKGMMVKNISPAFGAVYASVNYIVECGEIVGDKYKITFEENDGNEVADMERVGGSLIGSLPTPERVGYTFQGWFTDEGLTVPFKEKLMPKKHTTLYAKWEANACTVTFHVNGGDNWTAPETGTRAVSYGSAYGELPVPTKSGHGFVGWFTEQDGGTEVTADTIVELTEDHTLYAHWKQLKVIPAGVFDFGDAESGTYSKGQKHEVKYEFKPENGETYKESEFTFKYMRQGNAEYEAGLPVNAGTYNVTVSRAADNDYAKFEQTYTAVITIEKAVRNLGVIEVKVVDSGFNQVNLQLDDQVVIDDLSNDAAFTYQLVKKSGLGPNQHTSVSDDHQSVVKYLYPATDYYVTVKVTDDPNYLDAESTLEGASVVSTKAAPEGSWADYADTSWYNANDTEFTLTTAKQLAGLAKLVNAGECYTRKLTFKLGADIDLSAHQWVPIGIGTVLNNAFGYLVSGYSVFDGQGHTVKGLYTSGDSFCGLFGVILHADIQNLTLTDSYVCSSSDCGGIFGSCQGGLSRVQNCTNEATVRCTEKRDCGGIGGYIGNVVIDQCVNKGRVDGAGNTGGIAGNLYLNMVTNCINYGPVQGMADNKDGYGTGGIAGKVNVSDKYGNVYLSNCVNFGSVTGVTNVGGIAGLCNGKKAYILNSYTVGQVKGTNMYVGAVVGRNVSDKGAVHQCYYLKGSATCNGAERNASGTINGSMYDDETKNNNDCASFTDPKQPLSRDAGCGNANLIDALNTWVVWWNDGECNAEWVEGANGYPMPDGTINTNEGTKR